MNLAVSCDKRTDGRDYGNLLCKHLSRRAVLLNEFLPSFTSYLNESLLVAKGLVSAAYWRGTSEGSQVLPD